MSSIGFFATSEHADESTCVASNWVRENKLEAALPTAPPVREIASGMPAGSTST